MVSMNFNARKRKVGTKITLNLYDLSPANSYLFPIGLGIHHSGIEITGTEYTFASGSGIFSHSPREANGAIFRESIELGLFDGGNHEVDKILNKSLERRISWRHLQHYFKELQPFFEFICICIIEEAYTFIYKSRCLDR